MFVFSIIELGYEIKFYYLNGLIPKGVKRISDKQMKLDHFEVGELKQNFYFTSSINTYRIFHEIWKIS